MNGLGALIIVSVCDRRTVRNLVERAREEGPLQPWLSPPSITKSKANRARQGRFHHHCPELKQDPKVLWAPEIAHSFAEGTIEALDAGRLDIAFLRSQTAARWEANYCTKTGIYAEIATLVSNLSKKFSG